ncbi:Endonuclease V [Pseudoalteromonas sp. P1-9]|nr:Endonuclease V [Pseudoalteromonas sp. P1-9]
MVLSFPSLEMVELTVYEAPTVIPYIPGVLSFREGGAILSALAQLKISPDVLMFDGQGIAHPLGLGVASHIGVILNVRH